MSFIEESEDAEDDEPGLWAEAGAGITSLLSSEGQKGFMMSNDYRN